MKGARSSPRLSPSSATQWTVRAIETIAVGTSWMLTAQASCVAGT
jgi:hypothetical protein